MNHNHRFRHKYSIFSPISFFTLKTLKSICSFPSLHSTLCTNLDFLTQNSPKLCSSTSVYLIRIICSLQKYFPLKFWAHLTFLPLSPPVFFVFFIFMASSFFLISILSFLSFFSYLFLHPESLFFFSGRSSPLDIHIFQLSNHRYTHIFVDNYPIIKLIGYSENEFEDRD